MQSAKPKVIVIVGPTASGKTALSLALAKKFNGEIISADSRQIYRGMDLGTAKATPKERKEIKHYLIDIKNPDQDYSVGQFKKDAIKATGQILKKGKLPIVVGGTGLYISALVNNLEFPKVKEDKKLRAKLEAEIKKYGLAYLFDKLIKLDPEALYIVDPKNPRRVVRALEVALISGKPFTALRKKGKPLFDFLLIGLNPPVEVLKKRIAGRIREMTKDGLVKELKGLVKKYGYKAKPFDAIGYREIIDYLNGKISLEEAINTISQNTLLYAKRQMTWFKRDKRIKWLENYEEADKLIKNWLFIKTGPLRTG